MINEVVIPAAGLGERMSFFTKGKRSKLMLKIKDTPIIDYAIKEALKSNLKNINIIINENSHDLINFVRGTYPNIKTIITENTLGSAHSILKAKQNIKGDFFSVILPDIIIRSLKPAVNQLIDVFNYKKTNLFGWTDISNEKELWGGCEEMILEKQENLCRIKGIVSKRENPSSNNYISRYIVSRNFLDITESFLYKGKADDSDVLEEMLKKEDFFGLILSGKGFDTGIPRGYKNCLKSF